MQKLFDSKEKINFIIRLLILIIAMIIIISNLIIIKNNFKNNSNIQLVKAQVVSINYQNNQDEYLLKYTINGKEYQNTTSIDLHNYEVGEKINIYYKKNNPNKIIKKKSIIIPFILVILSIIAIIYAIIMTLQNIKEVNNIEKIIKEGLAINTTLEDIFVTARKNKFKLRTSYFNPVDQKKYVYISESFSRDFKDYLTTNGIKEITVYLNKENTNQYYVDLNSLRKD